jgi:hypothetical protein
MVIPQMYWFWGARSSTRYRFQVKKAKRMRVARGSEADLIGIDRSRPIKASQDKASKVKKGQALVGLGMGLSGYSLEMPEQCQMA